MAKIYTEEEKPPKCLYCDDVASLNEYFPNGDHPHKYWNLCKICFNKEVNDEEDDDEFCWDVVVENPNNHSANNLHDIKR